MYSITPKPTTNWNVFCPMLSAFVAANWLICAAPSASFFLDAGNVRQARFGKQLLHPRRQRMHRFRQVSGVVRLRALDLLIGDADFLHDGRRHKDHGQDHDEDDQRERGERGQVAPLAHPGDKRALHGLKQDRQDDTPEHRAKERREDPAEPERDDKQQEGEEFLVAVSAIHGLLSLEGDV